MGNTVHIYEEINLQEIIGVLLKNRYFISTFLSAGIIFGLLFSGITVIQNPVEYLYQAKVTVELVNGDEMSNQPQTMLHVMESSKILDVSMEKLKIETGNYAVRTDKTKKPNQYDVIVKGPDEELVVSLVNEVVAQGRSLIATSMKMKKNTIIDNGYIFGKPIEISKDVNVLMNIIISMILSGLISVFLIFIIRYMSGKVYTKDKIEKILGVKVLANIPNNVQKNKYKRFFQVR